MFFFIGMLILHPLTSFLLLTPQHCLRCSDDLKLGWARRRVSCVGGERVHWRGHAGAVHASITPITVGTIIFTSVPVSIRSVPIWSVPISVRFISIAAIAMTVLVLVFMLVLLFLFLQPMSSWITALLWNNNHIWLDLESHFQGNIFQFTFITKPALHYAKRKSVCFKEGRQIFFTLIFLC